MKTQRIYLFIFVLLAVPAVVQAQFNFTTNTDGSLNVYQYTGTGGAVTIPDTYNGLRITSIGSDAFFQDDTVTSVTIGTNVTTISANAIFQCTAVSTVIIPASVTNIGAGPIIDCQSLTTISVDVSNRYFISTNDILFNKSLTSLIEFPNGVGGGYTIDATVTNVGEAFIGNTLTAISVNSTNLYYASTNGVLFDKGLNFLISYPGGALGSYAVPTNVVYIVGAAFEYSLGVTNISIGASVTNIGEFAFYDCSSLLNFTVNSTNKYYSSTNGVLFDKLQTDLIQYPSAAAGNYVVPGTVTNLGGGAFGDAFGLTSIIIPPSVTSISEEAFYACDNLASVSLGGGVGSIGDQAFHDCSSLSDVLIPNSVTNIAAFAFLYCPGLNSVTIGSGVTTIGQEAFAECESLSSICFAGREPTDGGGIFFEDFSLGTINYANGAAGWGSTYDGIATAPSLECVADVPTLYILASGSKALVGWSDNYSGFTLRSTTNLASPSWTTVSTTPVVINNLYVVTNSTSGKQAFYRLQNP